MLPFLDSRTLGKLGKLFVKLSLLRFVNRVKMLRRCITKAFQLRGEGMCDMLVMLESWTIDPHDLYSFLLSFN